MSDAKVWVGLDLGQKLTNVCVVDDEGVELLQRQCETGPGPIEESLAAFGRGCIALVAVETGNDLHIVRKLRQAGFPVAMFESRKASKFLALRRNKTDASDARGLADLGRLGRHAVSQVHLKSLECQRNRGLLVMRKRLVMMRVAAENTLRSRLALNGRRLKPSYGLGALRRQVATELDALKADDGIDLHADLEPLVDLCESARSYIRELDREVGRIVKANEVCRLLMGIPGVGPICALSFYSAIETPDRFARPSDVAAYLGLTPRRHQSGGKSRTRGITKTGSKLTRSHLVTAATVFANTAPDCPLKRWFLALRERAGSMRARVALARKLAVMMAAMWKNGTPFDPLRPAAPPRSMSALKAVVQSTSVGSTSVPHNATVCTVRPAQIIHPSERVARFLS
ncbi:MAG TPA: IS110 family transposase [Sphingomicrobium sp.]